MAIMTVCMLALARQLGILHRRLPPSGARETPMGPAIGDPAPVIDHSTVTGGKEKLGATQGKRTILVFVSAGCKACEEVAPAMRSVARSERRTIQVTLISLDGDDATRQFVARNRLAFVPTISSYELAAAYGVMGTPYAIAIDENAVVRAKGLVNRLEHLESLVTALDTPAPRLAQVLVGEEQSPGLAQPLHESNGPASY